MLQSASPVKSTASEIFGTRNRLFKLGLKEVVVKL